MKICSLINAHGHTEIVSDTIEAVRKYVGEDVLVLIDGANWDSWGLHADLPVPKLQGFRHGWFRSPYRNMALGMKTLVDSYKADWYCYLEYDVLFTSSDFKKDLDGWCVGTNYRDVDGNLKLIENMIGVEFVEYKYLLGCCVFFSAEFVNKLLSFEFFEKFLYYTNDFHKDFFPGFDDYDLSEVLYPTLAHNLGGQVKGLSSWEDSPGLWRGNFKRYPIRFRPELDPSEVYSEASILHPVKGIDHPIRMQQRSKRKRHGQLQSL